MTNRNRAFINTALILVVLLFLLIITFSFLNPKIQAKNYPLSTRDIFLVIQVLKKNYIHEISTVKMLNFAIGGINKEIKLKAKINFNEIPNINTKSTDTAKAKFEREFNRVSKKYANKIDNNTLVYSALRKMTGMLAEPPYKDPYTSILTPGEYKILNEQMAGGNFGGIGVIIQLDKDNNNQLTVAEPVEDTPASQAGLRPKDQILAINGESTKGVDIDVSAKKIRGKVGTTVILSIKRAKLPIKDVKLRRAMIHLKTAVPKVINDNIGYIKLRFFGENTNSELQQALKRLRAEKVKAVILDLRNNTGGYLNASIDVCSYFLPAGTLVVSVVNYRTNYKYNYYSTGYRQTSLPLVLLVNKFSASASEITAGALQDTKRAVIIGEKTFGKGCVQEVKEILTDGGALKYTSEIYLTPLGKNINDIGIIPNIKISSNPEDMETPKDLQIRKAVEYLIKKYKI